MAPTIIAAALAHELIDEAAVIRQCLERIPEDKFDFRPHEKSMSLGRLASHMAEMFSWGKMMIETDFFEMEMADYTPFEATSSQQLLEAFDSASSEFLNMLEAQTDAQMTAAWLMKMDGHIAMEGPRVAMLKGMLLHHLIHHRGQLTVYLRLNDIPVPATYGPSVD